MSRVRKQRTRNTQLLLCESLEERRLLAVVTSAADSGPGTLREALAGADPVITFDVAAMGTSTITLTSDHLLVNRAVEIDGDDGLGGRVEIDGGGAHRGFFMSDENDATFLDVGFKNLIVQNGYSSADGGGVLTYESLTLDNVLVTGNYALEDGGGVGFGSEMKFAGDLIITNSELSSNLAGDDAGGLDFYNGKTLLISNSQISFNTAGVIDTPSEVSGAGFRVVDLLGVLPGQELRIQDSTITGNRIVGTVPYDRPDAGAGGIVLNGAFYFSQIFTEQKLYVSGSTFSDNTISEADARTVGGGLLVKSNYAVIEDTTFDANYAREGSGLYLANDYQDAAHPPHRFILTNVTVTNHDEGPGLGLPSLGGGISINDTADNQVYAEINDSTITGNSALYGGGVAISDVHVTINNSEISDNYAALGGGGLNVLAINDDPFTLSNSTVSGNTTGSEASYGYGGAILCSGAFMSIRQSTISYNESSGSGGGIFVHYVPQEVSIEQSTIFGNTAGIHFAGYGGGIHSFYNVNVSNSVISGNFDTNGASEYYGYVNPTNSYVGGTPLLGPLQDNGGGTLTQEPLAGSPLINAGDNSLVPFLTDQRGTVRMYDGTVDLGAVEYEQGNALCDFDGDGNCDIDDVDALTMESAAGTNDPAFDLNGDDLVDTADINDWLVMGGAANAAVTDGNPFLAGDFNLDGFVDGLDFIIWNANKFSSTGKWSLGDANGDGITDGLDFITWNANKFMSSASLLNNDGVPERDRNYVEIKQPDMGYRFEEERAYKFEFEVEPASSHPAVVAAPVAVMKYDHDAKACVVDTSGQHRTRGSFESTIDQALAELIVTDVGRIGHFGTKW